MYDAAGAPADAGFEDVELRWGHVHARGPVVRRALIDELGPELAWQEAQVGPVVLQYSPTSPGLYALEAPAVTPSAAHVWQHNDLVIDARSEAAQGVALHTEGVTVFRLHGTRVRVCQLTYAQWGLPRPPWQAWCEEGMPAYLVERTARDAEGASLWRAIAVGRLLRHWRPPLAQLLERDVHEPPRRWWQSMPAALVARVEAEAVIQAATLPKAGPIRLADLLLRDDLECLRRLCRGTCPALDDALSHADQRVLVMESAWLDPQLEEAFVRSADVWWAQP